MFLFLFSVLVVHTLLPFSLPIFGHLFDFKGRLKMSVSFMLAMVLMETIMYSFWSKSGYLSN
jgi:hypothetical protein